jgi:hypothetical protein
MQSDPKQRIVPRCVKETLIPKQTDAAPPRRPDAVDQASSGELFARLTINHLPDPRRVVKSRFPDGQLGLIPEQPGWSNETDRLHAAQ